MTKKIIPLGILSIVATACEPISLEISLDKEAAQELFDSIQEDQTNVSEDSDETNETQPEEETESLERIVQAGDEAFSEAPTDTNNENEATEPPENYEKVDVEDDNSAVNEEPQETPEENEVNETTEEEQDFEADESESGEDICDDIFEENRQALWIQTDYISNSDPTNTGTYGSSEAAEILSAQGVEWVVVRMDEMEFNPEYLMNYDLIVLYGQGTLGPLEATDAAVLEYWVLQGGGLMYHTYHPTNNTCDLLHSLPSNFGISCEPGNQAISGEGSPAVAHPVNNDIESVMVLGGEKWNVVEPAQVLIEDTSGNAFVAATEWGYGRVLGINDEWPLYNAGTGSHDISAADNYLLIDNAFCWLLGDCNDAQDLPEYFECDSSINFLPEVEYSQISLTDGCQQDGDEMICDANPVYGENTDVDVALGFCEDICYDHNECSGFFFQKHGNGHEICGFYFQAFELDGVWHGHQEGSQVCQKL